MNPREHENAQPFRELEWLLHYFKDHAREDLAHEIYEQLKHLRQRAQDSLENDSSDILEFKTARKNSLSKLNDNPATVLTCDSSDLRQF